MTNNLVARLAAAARRRLAALPLSSWRGIRAGFILSTGRTGTLRFAQVLRAAAEGGLTLHEPPPDLFDLGEAVARGAVGEDRAARELCRARQSLCNRVRREGLMWYVESNTNASYLPVAIRRVFDAPRFVHVVRDGRAVVRSLYSKTNRSRRPGAGRALFLDHDDHRARLAAVDFPDDPWAAEWHDLSRFQRICWHWAKKNALIRGALGDADDALVVRFEDLFDAARGYPGYHAIMEFLGLEEHLVLDDSEIHSLLGTPTNRTETYQLPPPDAWPPELEEEFQRIAGAEQRRYYP